MSFSPVVVSLPITDRQRSFMFYRDGLGFDPVGEAAEDGIPEPLQFVVNDGLCLMLVPRGGFGWVIGEHEVAQRGHSECVVSLGVSTQTEVSELIKRARQIGGDVVTEPGQQPWGYAGAFTDPDGHIWMVAAEPS
jgi:uncharacterized protein